MNVYSLYRIDGEGDRVQKTVIARSLSEIEGVDLYSVSTITKFPDGLESIGFIPAAIAMTAIARFSRALCDGVQRTSGFSNALSGAIEAINYKKL